MDRKDRGGEGGVEVGTQYPLWQLAKAIRTSETHPDAKARARAEDKVRAWTETFSGMLRGALSIGSRAPVREVPTWATLEVVKGGFATGRLLAEGELQPHEYALLERLGIHDVDGARAALNAWYLGDTGLEELRRMLQTGCYRIQVPEEGALLVVAWLLDHGEGDRARALLDDLAPFLPRLRFYPVPHTKPQSVGTLVHVRNVADTREALTKVRRRESLERQRESAQVWTPLYDRLVALWAETVREGEPLCQLPADFASRARPLLSDIQTALAAHPLCAWPRKPQLNFGRLHDILKAVVAAGSRVDPGQSQRVRYTLVHIDRARGLPGSARTQALRDSQRRQLERPDRVSFAQAVLRRLEGIPGDEGLDSLEALTAPVDGFPVPASIERKLQLALNAPVETLVEGGVIGSSETLARVVPQLSSQVRALGITEPSLRTLYASLYAAFRRRRSLLLLNLESQVRLEELPWVRAVDAHRTSGLKETTRARQTLEQLVLLALTSFPEVILPNKLLQEVHALLKGAELSVPVVDELAADIFMGDFAEKFLKAAQQAGTLLEGTLYERYYDIPFARLRAMNDGKRSRHDKNTSQGFAALCIERAGGPTREWSVAANGRVIEQAQILTTHNLATLVQGLELRTPLEPHLDSLARRCFTRVCELLELQPPHFHGRLRNVKNAAYAWRQMVFFLSLRPEETHSDFVEWMGETLSKRRGDLPRRLGSAVVGLRHAVRGGRMGNAPPQARCFLGWTVERHWVLG
ncbi:hypothetical protein HPC49_23350 [Pyxidicoccus fallax]|uniref:Uncharacterized protein n=1 Tax=Pyxidicoccus fallax TaxID=394095 RepID=A0A848LJG4_9BACT|nr:hypothetical protein [Pyxidicoccus fallax]NMO17863.1 hypothetical protein [Pyxidicoccus fallax]NPC81151.1 hypothetical protein [Pyxidicoccus fallax]